MKSEPLDARDQALLLSRQHERDRLSNIHLSPLAGDVIHLLDGTIRRVAMVHYATKRDRATLQPSSATIGSPSLYWGLSNQYVEALLATRDPDPDAQSLAATVIEEIRKQIHSASAAHAMIEMWEDFDSKIAAGKIDPATFEISEST